MTTKLEQAALQALEAVEVYEIKLNSRLCNEAITALREALANTRSSIRSTSEYSEQAEQEPVAWALSHSMGLEFGSKYPIQETKEAAEQMARQHMGAVVVTPLYDTPVRTKDLTDEEIMKINVDTASIVPTCDRQFHFARAVIAADREKNK